MFDITPDELAELLEEHAFSSEELVQMSGVDLFAFRNWMKRGTLDIGKKHRLGRWAFSPADCMRVSAMVDLNDMGVAPATAAKVAESPVELIRWFIAQTIKKRESDYNDGYSVLFASLSDYASYVRIDGDDISARFGYWSDRRFTFIMPDGSDFEHEGSQTMLRISHIMLASGLIADDIMTKVHEVMEAST